MMFIDLAWKQPPIHTPRELIPVPNPQNLLPCICSWRDSAVVSWIAQVQLWIQGYRLRGDHKTTPLYIYQHVKHENTVYSDYQLCKWWTSEFEDLFAVDSEGVATDPDTHSERGAPFGVPCTRVCRINTVVTVTARIVELDPAAKETRNLVFLRTEHGPTGFPPLRGLTLRGPGPSDTTYSFEAEAEHCPQATGTSWDGVRPWASAQVTRAPGRSPTGSAPVSGGSPGGSSQSKTYGDKLRVVDTDGDNVNRAVGGISLATAQSPAPPNAFLRDPVPWGSRGRRQGVLPVDGAGALAQFWHRPRGQFVSSGTPAPDRER